VPETLGTFDTPNAPFRAYRTDVPCMGLWTYGPLECIFPCNLLGDKGIGHMPWFHSTSSPPICLKGKGGRLFPFFFFFFKSQY